MLINNQEEKENKGPITANMNYTQAANKNGIVMAEHLKRVMSIYGGKNLRKVIRLSRPNYGIDPYGT